MPGADGPRPQMTQQPAAGAAAMASPARGEQLHQLEAQKQELLARRQRTQRSIARTDSLRHQLTQTQYASGAALPPDALEREHFFALHKHLAGMIAGFIHTLAELDFGEEAVLLGGGAGGDQLDVALQSMRSQHEQFTRAAAELPQAARAGPPPPLASVRGAVGSRPLALLIAEVSCVPQASTRRWRRCSRARWRATRSPLPSPNRMRRTPAARCASSLARKRVMELSSVDLPAPSTPHTSALLRS